LWVEQLGEIANHRVFVRNEPDRMIGSTCRYILRLSKTGK
jgi:hypothetical protein